MKVKLAENRLAQVKIFHCDIEDFIEHQPPELERSLRKEFRNTKMLSVAQVTIDNRTHQSYAKCHYEDQFCKRRGAMLALSYAVKMPETGLSKADRSTIFAKMFTRAKSPYELLFNLVIGKPELARKVAEAIINKSVPGLE